MRQVASGNFPSLTVDSESFWNLSQDSAEVLNDSVDSKKDSQTSMNLGRKNCRSSFSLVLTVMQKTHEMLLTSSENNKTNIRSFYYDLQPELIPNLTMKKVNNAVNSAEKLIGCTRWDLGFVATSKGLVAGDLTLNFNEKSITYLKTRGDLIPQEMFELSSIRTSAKFVLVVEKDTIFQKLLGEREMCPEYLNCILITGKGEPDIATRILVHRLSEIERLPTYILVDNDPYGFEILCTYRFGSKEHKPWASPSVRWIGIHPEEIKSMGIIPMGLKVREIEKVKTLRTRNDLQSEANLCMQLRKMKKIGKAEIESVANLSYGFLTRFYIPEKIKLREFY
ncbi:meiotic recombination protein W68 [Belonocnema kinseyi]|uniref:meiotic recombination protein W68 n=1 Tax=Belonocnema kinseyi TaxID=2817044 RepID=UPI00143CD175|nr:meiotic recombination protein W68 [Belonocnema kinseyi]